jgi:hypothetical protein
MFELLISFSTQYCKDACQKYNFGSKSFIFVLFVHFPVYYQSLNLGLFLLVKISLKRSYSSSKMFVVKKKMFGVYIYLTTSSNPSILFLRAAFQRSLKSLFHV